MKAKLPFRLDAEERPYLEIAGARLAMEPQGCMNNRLMYRWWIRLPDGTVFSECDIGAPEDNWEAAFRALLSFLGACAEAYRHRASAYYAAMTSVQAEHDNLGLFPPPVAEWAAANDDEIGSLKEEIDQPKGTFITEED